MSLLKKAALFFLAIFTLIVVAVLVYIQYFNTELAQTKSQVAPEVTKVTAITTTDTETPVISNDKREVLEKVGIDTENISVTSEMIACAEEIVGRERLYKIAESNEPSLFEIGKLMSCL